MSLESELFEAVKQSSPSNLKELIIKGANLNARSIKRVSPLIIACDYNRFENALILLNHNGNINARDQKGRNAFMYACAYGDLKLVDLLIEYGADPMSQDNEGNIGLMYAAYTQNLDVVKFLADERSLLTKNIHGDTAETVARKAKRTKVTDYLEGKKLAHLKRISRSIVVSKPKLV